MANKTQDIKAYILAQVSKHPTDIATKVVNHFSVTRMTATRQLQALIAEKKIIKTGKTSDTHYYLSESKNKSFYLKIDKHLDEFRVFEKYFSDELKTLEKNQIQILEYCCTELINNAKDHSQGTSLHCKIHWDKKGISIEIADNGIGIFRNLQRALHLSDLQEGLLALSKGKVTTDPKNHTGEGVFFSSRAADRFTLEANEIAYIKDNKDDDWYYQKSRVKKGTRITLFLYFDCARVIHDLFIAFTEQGNYQFDKTEILVELAKFGDERYISRSQAKRILSNLDRFSRIILDFRNVETVGQGFVDEVFRVFQNKHPNTKIEYRHANENVSFMIRRGLHKQN